MTGAPFFLVLLLVAALWFPDVAGWGIGIIALFGTMFAMLFYAARVAASERRSAPIKTLELLLLPISAAASALAFINLNVATTADLWSWPMFVVSLCAPWAIGYTGGLLNRWLPQFSDDPWVNPLNSE